MRLFGYARVSASKQSLEIQKQALIKAGVKESRIFYNKITTDIINETDINALLAKVRKGDVILITKLDRLGRNTVDMIDLLNKFNKMKVGVRFLQDGISTEGESGKMIVTIASAVVEAERLRILERTNEGRIDAKLSGIRFGAKRKINRDKLLELKLSGIGASIIAKEMGISRAAIYKILKEEIKY